MFAGAQIVTTKLVPSNKRQQTVDGQNDDKTTQDLLNMAVLVPSSKAAIVVETEAEKIERKALAQEKKLERIVEQQELIHQMENLVEKVLIETPLPKHDEENLRSKIKTIVKKVNKHSSKIDSSSIQSSFNELSSASCQMKTNSTGQSSTADDQQGSLIWYHKSSNS